MESNVISTFLDKLGNELVDCGYITKSQLDETLEEKLERNEHLGEVLIRLGFITADRLNEFLAERMNIPHIDLNQYDFDIAAVSLIDEETARKYRMLPLFEIEDVITVAMADTLDIFAIEQIKGITNKVVEPVLATEEAIIGAIDSYWGTKNNISEFIDKFEKEQGEMDFTVPAAAEPELGTEVDEKPIIKLVNSIITEAVQAGASDIHIEPDANSVKIRYRIDGVLGDVSTLAKKYQSPVTTRIKVMTKMDIGQRRKSQDGKIHLKVGSKKIDLRVSTYPVVYGEKVVLRILDLSSVRVGLEKLGLDKAVFEQYNNLIRLSNGIVLVTGPTGSGKTTTLYATLNVIKGEHLNIMTIEDPVEYEMSGINQGEVDEKAGVTFASALRAIVRQDPDVILVGEIRDFETAELAIRASLTGHLVFSTLHTNTAAGAISRLIDMGVEPFLLASTVRAILGQRLIRLVCDECKKPYRPEEKELKLVELTGGGGDVQFFRGAGCNHCRSTGYKRRIGIFELLVPDEEVKGLINSRAPYDLIQEAAVRKGMVTMRGDGGRKVQKGLTTVDEVIRVC